MGHLATFDTLTQGCSGRGRQLGRRQDESCEECTHPIGVLERDSVLRFHEGLRSRQQSARALNDGEERAPRGLLTATLVV